MSSNPPGDWRGGPAPSAPSTPGAWAPQGQPTYGTPPPGAPGYPYPPPGAPPYPAAPGPQAPPPQGGYPAYGQPAGTYPGPAYPAPPAPGQPTYPQASAPTQPAYVPAPDQPPPMPPAGQWAPPDAADSQVPPAAPVPPAAETRRSRERAPILGGVILAGIGLFLLVGQVVDDAGEWVPLLIGLIFLAAFVTRREYGFLVAGSIITGVGAGVVLQDAAPDDLSGAVMTLSIAAGFLAIWVVGTLLRLRENHWWPFIPGGILALVGASQLSDADVDGVLRWWPLIIVAIGVLIIVRAWLRPGRL